MKVPPYYKCGLSKVLENNVACFHWDRRVMIHETAPHNNPDIQSLRKPFK
jgi:hypothetical protein